MRRFDSPSTGILALILAPILIVGWMMTRHKKPAPSVQTPTAAVSGGYPSGGYPSGGYPSGIPAANTPAQWAALYSASATPLNRLTPIPNGPGLIVCDPVAAASSRNLANFGAGCGRWLNLAAAGQFNLDRTPLIESTSRAIRELGKTNLALTAGEAFKLPSMNGATHAAVGTISGTAARCTLTYSLYDLSTHKQIGAPISTTNSEQGIASRLPAMAQQICQRMHIGSAPAPHMVSLDPADLALIGRVAWGGDMTMRPSDLTAIRAMALKSPLAGITAIASYVFQTPTDEAKFIQRLCQQAPDNALVLSTMARDAPGSFYQQWPVAAAALAKHPNNYLLSICQVQHCRGASGGDSTPTTDERTAAEHAYRCDSRNPDACLTLGWTIGNQADTVRGGATYVGMDSTQVQYVETAYPEWVKMSHRAVTLDPLYGKAWLRLSTAAAFDGDEALADRAIWKAIRFDSHNTEVYWWGMQLYQEKWFDNMEKLDRVARAAAAADFANASETIYIARTLRYNGFPDMAATLLSRMVKQYRGQILHHPDDSIGWCGLADGLYWQGHYTEAAAGYQHVLKLTPDDGYVHYYRAQALAQDGQDTAALNEYRETLRLLPGYPPAEDALSRLTSKRPVRRAPVAGNAMPGSEALTWAVSRE